MEKREMHTKFNRKNLNIWGNLEGLGAEWKRCSSGS